MSLVVDSNLIGKILSPALKFWLHSQVEAVESLDLAIEGKNRQILRGHVPGVSLKSEQAIYQGLQLGRVAVRGENIRVNIGQVIKGKPLQLLEPIRVQGEVQISQAHLQRSLTSDLLGSAFNELLAALLEQQGIIDAIRVLDPYHFTWQEITLKEQHFELQGRVSSQTGDHHALVLSANLHCPTPKTLHLENIQITGLPLVQSATIDPLVVDLGEDVDIESLQLTSGELRCLGKLLIRP